jgi:signal transduction histidine kinase
VVHPIRRLLLLLLLILILLPAPKAMALHENPVPFRLGHMDASGTSLHHRSSLYLNGEWQFYWQQLLSPSSFNDRTTAFQWVQVPHVWKSNETAPSNEGYATYRMTMTLHPDDVSTLKGIYIHGIASAYYLWVNGELLLENGVVGMDQTSMSPKHYSRVAVFQPKQQELEIVIQVSNFVQRKGGIWEKIELGEADSILFAREKSMTLQTFISSGLFLIGLYHLALYWFRKRDKIAFYMAICSLLFSIRTMLLGDNILVRLLPQLDWELMVKVEYLSPYLSIPLFMLFVRELYPKETTAWVTRITLLVGFVFCATVLVFPARVFTYTMSAFQIYTALVLTYIVGVFIVAAYRRREHARLQCSVILLMIAGVTNDMLYHNHVITSIDFSPLGIYIYLFAQTLIIAFRYSQFQYKVERMSEELKDWNAKLEERIRERTHELEASHTELRIAYDQLNRMEESRRSLIANISHELKTPMTTIQGYIKAMIDGIVPMNDSKPLQMVYGKVLFVGRLVQDLFELSKLESNQIKFAFTTVPVKEFLDSVLMQFQLDIRSKGYEFELFRDERLTHENPNVIIDQDRILQVMTNLLYNAVKFTPEGGSITVRASRTAQSELLIEVKDTGVGMEEDVIPHVFERFYKGARHKPLNRDGTGLGLSIVKEIVTQHGGQVGVTSRLQEGSTFYFTLPLRDEREELSDVIG